MANQPDDISQRSAASTTRSEPGFRQVEGKIGLSAKLCFALASLFTIRIHVENGGQITFARRLQIALIRATHQLPGSCVWSCAKQVSPNQSQDRAATLLRQSSGTSRPGPP